jgi:tetratricopeptide (TPR) repeat protein
MSSVNAGAGLGISRLDRHVRLALTALTALTSLALAGTLGGCTYLGNGKDGQKEPEKLEFDLSSLGIKKGSTGPLETPPPGLEKKATAWSEIGSKYEKLGMFDYAEKCYLKCTELSPSDKFYWHSLANARKNQNKFEGSRQAFIKSLDYDVNDIYTMAAIAFADAQLVKDVEARYYLLTALSVRPDFQEAWRGLYALAHRIAEDKYMPQLGRLRNSPGEGFNRCFAQSMIAAYLNDHRPEDEFYWGYQVSSGYFLMNDRKYAEAESTLKKVIAAKPGSWEALRAKVGLTTLYTRIGRDDEALSLIAELEKESPKQPFIWFNKALVTRRKGDLNTAIEYLGKATSLAPDHGSWGKLFGEWMEEERKAAKS